MRMNRIRSTLAVLLLSVGLVFFLLVPDAGAQAPTGTPVVQAVLFYRSSCGHCVQLVVEILPPIIDKYKDQLQVFYCDVSKPEGDALFTAAIDHFNIKTIGVPTIIVGDDVLIGSVNIQKQFPGIIDAGLSHGGLGWPAIPGLDGAFVSAGSMQIPVYAPPEGVFSSVPTLVAIPTVEAQASNISLFGREMAKMGVHFNQDPLGNSLSVFVLIAMLISGFYGIYRFLKQPGLPLARQPVWVTPVLCMIGCAIAGYLAYLEITFANAICGPVGHCQSVQQSEYARLFGLLPVGLLGVAGYAAIMITWLVARLTHRSGLAGLAGLALLGLAAFGMLFSIYLTFLEPFVIGATCIWCLASAVLMTVLFNLSIAPGKLAFTHLFKKPGNLAISAPM